MEHPLRTDYETLSERYDEDRRDWQDVPADDHIAALPRGSAVLDVGCGTGTYLRAQAEAFTGVRLFGVDPSPAMLRQAVSKAPDARFALGRGEELPCRDESFAYVTCSYVFHHVADKRSALEEVVRVLARGGRFRLVNIEPYSLTDWWVYAFFDGAYENDMNRFWPPERIADDLDGLGCDVDFSVDVHDVELTSARVREDAERRVISQLAVLDEERYASGLERIRALDGDAVFRSQGATLTLIATKR